MVQVKLGGRTKFHCPSLSKHDNSVFGLCLVTSFLQWREQKFSDPGVLNISVPIVKMWKLTFLVQYFNNFEMYNSI